MSDDNILSMKSKNFKVILKLTVSLIILVFIFQRVDYREIFRVGMNDARFFFLAFLLVPIRLLIKGARWQVIMQKAIPGIGFLDSIKSMLVSIALGLFTPMRVGQAGVVTYIESDNNIKTGLFAYFEVIVDLIIIIITAGLSLFLIFFLPVDSLICKTEYLNADKLFGFNLLLLPRHLYLYSALALFIIAFLSVLIFAKPGLFLKFPAKAGGKKLGKFLSQLKEINLYKKDELLKIIVYSIIIFLINMVQFLFLSYSFSMIPVRVVFISYSLIVLGVCLPITVAGLGAREGVAAWIYSSFGVNSTVGIKASFLLFSLNMVLPAIIGIVIYNLKGHVKKIKE